jgi:hypothetical protein
LSFSPLQHIFSCLNIQTPKACEFLLEVELMAFFQCYLRWRGTNLSALNVLAVVFKVVWQPILEKVLAIHGVIYFQILPNPKQMKEFINSTLEEQNMVKEPEENIK